MNEETITVAGGCFWCTEAIFQRLRGVTKVVSGYTGGNVENPSYEEVSTGTTGHAEAIQITFNPKQISVETLLEVFFKLHDPTTLNKQGADEGTQYRSAIFYHTEEQKEVAQQYKEKLEQEKVFDNPIVTEIVPFTAFYKAEEFNQDFYNRNKGSAYCSIVIDPKIKKLMDQFKDISM